MESAHDDVADAMSTAITEDGVLVGKAVEDDVGRKATGRKGVPKREQEILSRAARGLTDKEIAADLGISPETVNTYWRRIRARFRAASRTEVVAIAVRNETEQQISDITSEKDALLFEIAERKRVEQQLSLSEARWRSLIENSPNLVLTLDALGRITYGNLPASVAWIDWELRLPSLAEEEDQPAVEAALQTALEQGKPTTVEYRSVLPDRQRWCSARVAPLPGGDPQASAIALIEDETEAHQRLEVLQYANEFLKVVAEITTKLMGAGPEDLDDKVNSALAALGDFCGVDTAYVCVVDEASWSVSTTYEWHRELFAQMASAEARSSVEEYRWSEGRHRNFETVYIPNVANLPSDAEEEKRELMAIGARSVLAVPVTAGGQYLGAAGFLTYGRSKEWPQDQIALLRLVGEMLGGALTRRDALCQAMRLAEKQRALHLAWRSAEPAASFADLWKFLERGLKAAVGFEWAVIPGGKADEPAPEAATVRRAKEAREVVSLVDGNGRWLLGQMVLPAGQIQVVGIGRPIAAEPFRKEDIGTMELSLESCRRVVVALQR